MPASAPPPISTKPYALVVDDDPMILMDTCSILEDAGFRYHEAADGDEAKRLLEEHWASVVLLFSDVDMPGETDGFALARHVDVHWPDIAIVIASGHVLVEDDALPDRATFISKPFNARVVREHLRAILPDGAKPAPLRQAV